MFTINQFIMFNVIVQFIAIAITYLVVMWYTYMQVEVWGFPKFLQFKPFICRTCYTFWTLVVVYTITLLIGMTYTAIGGYALAVLNAIAMKVDQRRRTITVEEFENKVKTN